jgi:hypothetical protein
MKANLGLLYPFREHEGKVVRRIRFLAQFASVSALLRRTRTATRLWRVNFQAAATAARHMFIAEARKLRRVLAEARWHWTLQVLQTTASRRS